MSQKFISVIVFSALFLFGFNAEADLKARELYVSVSGSGDCSRSAPCTLEQARSLVREINKNMTGDINVCIGDGVYNLDETFILTPDDSGANGFSITWQGADGARPIITSSEKISGWEIHDEVKNIWKVTLPKRISTFEHLWLENGVELPRAWSGFNPSYLRRIKKGIEIDRSFGKDFSQWKNPYDVVLVGKHVWFYLTGYVDSFKGNKLYWSDELLKSSTSDGIMRGNHNILVAEFPKMDNKTTAIENAYELIDEEGEWYFDKRTKALYIKTPQGFSRDTQVRYPKLKILFKLDGEIFNPIENIVIKNLHFRYNDGDKVSTTAACPTESFGIDPPPGEGALQINAGRNIRVENTSFKHIGNEALNFDLSGENLTISANSFEDVYGSAISIVQSNLRLPETWYDEIHPVNVDKMFKNVVVSNNYLHNVANGNIRFAHAITYSELVHNILIDHNEIHGSGGAGVRNTWRYGAVEGGHAQGVVLSWNKVKDHNNKGFSDFSALYIDCANGPTPNSIHHNYVNGVGKKSHNHPIYLDVHVRNTDVYNNVLTDIPETENPVFGPFWIAFIGSTDNRAFNNWVEGGNKKEVHQETKTLFWFKKRNEVFDNTFYETPPEEWPEEAQEVIDNAGLEPQHQYIKDYLKN